MNFSRIVIRGILIGSIMAIAGTFSACTRTYISTGAPGVPCPNGSERLCLTIHGAFGRQYIQKTSKLVDVWIGHGYRTNKVTLFSSRYVVVGSDLTWDIHWQSAEKVIVHLYDYGDGLSQRLNPSGSNHITTLIILQDKKTGNFVETKESQ